MRSAVFLLLTVSSCLGDPQIFKLNQYNNLKNSYSLSVENGANLYLASSDDVSQLQNIQIVTGATTITLDKMGNNPLKLTSNTLTLRSTISESSAALITGFLYATTQVQANDATFSVIVVNGSQTLTRSGDSSTTVVLNTHFWIDFPLFDAPEKTTYVAEIEQLSNTNLNFHYDIPSYNWTKVTINQFFENPQYSPNYDDHGNPLEPTKVLFTNVEPLQINLPYWYITATGPFKMVVDNKYVNQSDHTATSENTTGLFVVTDVMLPQNVHFTVDKSRERNVGFLVSSFVQFPLSVWLTGGQSILEQNYSNKQKIWHAQLITKNDGTLLTMNSTALTPGVFYCQYFVYSGDVLPTDPPTTPSTSTVAPSSTTIVTSTNLATGKLEWCLISMIMSFLWCCM